MSKWKKVKLKDYIEQIRGVSYKLEDAIDMPTEGYYPILRANNIKDNALIFDDFVYVKENKIKKEQMIQKGDIIVCASSGSKELVGKAAQAKKDLQMSFGAFCKGVRAKNILPEYLGNYFKSPIYRKTISKLSAGASINNIKSEHLDNLEIPLPAMEKQRKIAERLDAVSDLLAKQKQLLAEQDTLIQSLFYDMFGDHQLSLQKEQWKKISEIATVAGGSTPKTQVAEYWDGDLNWFTPAELENCSWYVYSSQRKITKAGVKSCHLEEFPVNTILLSSRAPIGKIAIAKETFYCNQGFKNIVCGENIAPIYLYHLLMYNIEYLKSLGKGATFKEISKRIVEDIKIPVPPLELQEKFAAIVEQIETEKSKIKSAITETQTLFNARMAEYFEE